MVDCNVDDDMNVGWALVEAMVIDLTLSGF